MAYYAVGQSVQGKVGLTKIVLRILNTLDQDKNLRFYTVLVILSILDPEQEFVWHCCWSFCWKKNF